jgi:hypothetical protein
MPVLDWQFLVVTLIAAGAVAIVVRRLMPARKATSKGVEAPIQSAACSHCANSESSATPPRPARTATVPVVSLSDLRGSAHQPRR